MRGRFRLCSRKLKIESGRLGCTSKEASVDKNDQVREAVTFNFQLYTFNSIFAGMMELADMRDLGSRAAMRWGSNPHARTIKRVRKRCTR